MLAVLSFSSVAHPTKKAIDNRTDNEINLNTLNLQALN
jgi:hypothetical protein